MHIFGVCVHTCGGVSDERCALGCVAFSVRAWDVCIDMCESMWVCLYIQSQLVLPWHMKF